MVFAQVEAASLKTRWLDKINRFARAVTVASPGSTWLFGNGPAHGYTVSHARVVRFVHGGDVKALLTRNGCRCSSRERLGRTRPCERERGRRERRSQSESVIRPWCVNGAD